MANGSIGLSIELILDEASKMFATNGYRASSLNDLASKLNVTKPALYYHFKNKHEILKSIFDIIMKIYLDAAIKIEKLDASPTEKLDLLIEAHALAVLNHRNYSIIFFKEANELDADAFQKLNTDIKRYENIFEQVILNGIAEEQIKPINSQALIMGIFGMINWLYQWFEDDGELTKKQICTIYRDILKNGYLLK